jgi:hypothetical protein
VNSGRANRSKMRTQACPPKGRRHVIGYESVPKAAQTCLIDGSIKRPAAAFDLTLIDLRAHHKMMETNLYLYEHVISATTSAWSYDAPSCRLTCRLLQQENSIAVFVILVMDVGVKCEN